MRKNKYIVYGEYGGKFTNLKEAKACAKEASILSGDIVEVWIIEGYWWKIAYNNGKLVK